jgi:hypothetical protein
LPIHQQNNQIKEKIEKSSQKNAYSPLLFLGTFFLFGKFCDNSIFVAIFSDSQNNDLSQLNSWPKGYQPVPIHTVPEQYDFMVKFQCFKF